MTTPSRWHDPPRLRTLEADDGDERHATWLELFFDLVFVVAIAQLADGLAEDPSVHGFLVFAGLFVPVWWAWVGFTFYADRFDTDDPPHRVLMLVGMFTVAVLASVIPEAFHGDTAAFALAYAAVRAVVVLLNARAWWHLPSARPLLNIYIPAFTASVVLFLISAAVEPPYRYWLWALALAIDLGTPIGSGMRIRVVPIHASHIPERVGLFTIIVFGESILGVVIGTTTVSWDLESAAVAALGFVDRGGALVALLRLRGHVGRSRHGARGPDLPLRAPAAPDRPCRARRRDQAGDQGDRRGAGWTNEASWIIGVGVALFMASVAVMHLATTHSRRDVDLWLRVGTAALALGLGAVGTDIGVIPMLAILAGVLAAQVVLELATHDSHRHGEGRIEIG